MWTSHDEQAERERVHHAMQDPQSVFVFGSNLQGLHGAGAAREAYLHFGAVPGIGRGWQGQSYAFPTKDWTLQTRPLTEFPHEWALLANVAAANPDRRFIVTRVGCGLAGYTDADVMGTLPAALPPNIELPPRWRRECYG